MRILQVSTYLHHKNEIGFRLMCESIKAEHIKTADSSYFSQNWDIVFVPAEYIPPSFFPNAKFIMYGPHNFVCVSGVWKKGNAQFPSNCFYNLLSDWVIKAQDEMGGLSLVSKAVPFAVDIQAFHPVDREKNLDCFVYFKNRKRKDLVQVLNFLESQNISYEVIEYGKYNEESYKTLLSRVKFGIWVDGHESQGFAFLEALSSGVPLVVYNCESMYDVNSSDFEKFRGTAELKATSCPYWSGECGLCSSKLDETFTHILVMKEQYSTFQPREFVVRELSPLVCMNRLLQTCENLK